MEAPRFFNNKAGAFSSAFLAVSIAACGGNGSGGEKSPSITPLQPTSTGRQIETPPPESEQKVNVVISYYLNSEAPDLPLDENCGDWLLAGDQSRFKTPLPPGDKMLEFTANISAQEGIILFGGLPAVANTHVKAEFEFQGGIAVLPLGTISKVEPTRIYFTPYLPANGIPNENCVQPQPPMS